MTSRELQQYKYIQKEVEALRVQIDKMYDTYRSPSFDAEGGGTPSGNRTEDTIERIERLKEKYGRQISELMKQQENIENWMLTVESNEIRSIVRWYYIIGLDWKETSRKMYGDSAYEFNARKVLLRYLGEEL